MKTPSAHAYVRALQVWGLWLRHWRLTRDPRVLRTTLACKLIAAEKLAIWQAELGLRRSVWAARAERAAREEFSIHRVLRQIRRDERGFVRHSLTSHLSRWSRKWFNRLMMEHPRRSWSRRSDHYLSRNDWSTFRLSTRQVDACGLLYEVTEARVLSTEQRAAPFPDRERTRLTFPIAGS
jgi:hypothetical protein